jgi:hypothetical protein
MRRVRHSRTIVGVLFATGLALFARDAIPIVMRHDVAEKQFIELAKRYPAAVQVRPASARQGGEGTLIAPRWALTAAHVAAGLKPGDLVVAAGKSHPIERVFIHPEWKQINDVKVDIALVLLRQDVRDVEPVLLFQGPEPVGSLVTFVGRGGFGTGAQGVRGEDGRLRAATNRIDAIEGPFLKFRFDRHGDPAMTDLEGISGPGDSGGAAFLERDGKLFVVGVSSWQDTRPTGRVQGIYGVIENYVRVSYFHEWITRTMRSASSAAR